MSGRIVPGLCSVTFRALAPDAVIALAEQAELRAIEWGADVHVPPGDIDLARAVAGRCGDAGIACPSYGTYFFAGRTEPDELDPLIASAHALGAARMRVWAPFGVGPGAPASEVEPIAQALAEACRTAADAQLELALEFHPGTLTHTAASTLTLLEKVGCETLHSYWQPESGKSIAHSLAELRGVLPRLANLHVFAWAGQPPERLPLAAHAELWREVLREAARSGDRAAYLEFVRDDDRTQLLRDAATLRHWIEELP